MKNGNTVVITGADNPTGLGTARSAKAKNLEIIGISSNTKAFSCKSKVWDKIIYTDNNKRSYLNTLLSLGEKLQKKCVLLPAQDDVVKLISENRKRMNRFYKFTIPDINVVDTLLNKASFHEWALSNGFLVPSTLILDSAIHLKKNMHKMSFPIAIKPEEKSEGWLTAGFNEKILFVESKDKLEKIFPKLRNFTQKFIIQEWVPGKDKNIYFCLSYFNKRGSKVAAYTGRKLLQWPPLGGSTSIAVGERNDYIEKITTECFSKIGLIGLGSLEFKKSEKDNRFYIIEPTVGRCDLQSYIAVSGGINLTELAILDAIGDRCVNNKNRRKGLWIDDSSLIDSLKHNFKAKQISFKLFRDIITKNIAFSNFDLKDLGPFRSIIKEKFRNKLKVF